MCGFAFDAYVPSISECRAAMNFHENSLCDSLYLEVAEIENDEPVYVWVRLCEMHLYILRTDLFSMPYENNGLICNIINCGKQSVKGGYVKVSK